MSLHRNRRRGGRLPAAKAASMTALCGDPARAAGPWLPGEPISPARSDGRRAARARLPFTIEVPERPTRSATPFWHSLRRRAHIVDYTTDHVGDGSPRGARPPTRVRARCTQSRWRGDRTALRRVLWVCARAGAEHVPDLKEVGPPVVTVPIAWPVLGDCVYPGGRKSVASPSESVLRQQVVHALRARARRRQSR